MTAPMTTSMTAPAANAGSRSVLDVEAALPRADAVEAFAGELVTMLNAGMLTLMISIGHRTGLFDCMSSMPAADSSAIAAASGLDGATCGSGSAP